MHVKVGRNKIEPDKHIQFQISMEYLANEKHHFPFIFKGELINLSISFKTSFFQIDKLLVNSLWPLHTDFGAAQDCIVQINCVIVKSSFTVYVQLLTKTLIPNRHIQLWTGSHLTSHFELTSKYSITRNKICLICGYCFQ